MIARRRRRGSRPLAVVGFNLALFLLLLELVGLVDHFLETRSLYYFHRPAAPPPAAIREPDREVSSYRLHPYFGYVLRPAVDPPGARRRPQNNHGFDEPHDYPYLPRGEDEVIVGIFGGSVASKLYSFESRRQVLAGRIAAALGKRRGDVTLLNFAQGGFKQPQQLLIYDYFRSLGQRFDVVINVDGFNEVAIAGINAKRGIAVEMPSTDHIYSLREIVGRVEEGESLQQQLRARVAWDRHATMVERAWAGEAWELRFAAGFLIDRMLAKIYHRRFRAALEAASHGSARGGESWLFLSPGSSEGELTEDELSGAVDLWARASSLMHSQQSSGGGLFLHFLQPNQYHARRRAFGEHERAVALNPQSPYAEPARRGYPRLSREAARLRAAGVPVYDLTQIFDDVEAEVYVDNCCHYTDAGQEVVADAVGDAVVAAIEKRRQRG